MPLAVEMDCAIGVVMNPCITSWVAPGKLVSTVMVALCRAGYCRTGSETSAVAPTIRMSRLTTIASTGRRMNRSVNDVMIAGAVSRAPAGRQSSRPPLAEPAVGRW